MSEREQIGTYTLTEDEVFTRSYEVAAWYTKILVPAGEYPVYLTRTPEGFPQFVVVPLEGTIVEEYTPSLFGGVPVGPGNGDKRVGEPARKVIQTYPFMVQKDPERWAIEVTYPNHPERDFSTS